jgi:hypothetical protein
MDKLCANDDSIVGDDPRSFTFKYGDEVYCFTREELPSEYFGTEFRRLIAQNIDPIKNLIVATKKRVDASEKIQGRDIFAEIAKHVTDPRDLRNMINSSQQSRGEMRDELLRAHRGVHEEDYSILPDEWPPHPRPLVLAAIRQDMLALASPDCFDATHREKGDALLHAISIRHEGMIRLLINGPCQASASRDDWYGDPLINAVTSGAGADIIRLLLNAPGGPGTPSEEAINAALNDEVRMLIEEYHIPEQ